jgi:hypothetical protein
MKNAVEMGSIVMAYQVSLKWFRNSKVDRVIYRHRAPCRSHKPLLGK